MAESDTHRTQMTDALIYPLKAWFRQRSDVYVSGNMFVYYEEGHPQAVVAPDVFVVYGVPNHLRRVYKVWVEGKTPDVVFELTSKSTRREDLSDKRFLYEELGVREYFLFDPLREYLRPCLQGFRREDDYFHPIPVTSLPGGEWQLSSQVLGLMLQTDGSDLRLLDPVTDMRLLMAGEEADARRAAEVARRAAEAACQVAETRAEAEAAARQAAEAEIGRLRALLAGKTVA